MLLAYVFQCIFLFNYQISAQNISSGQSINKKLNLVRRQWPDIKFEDLDIMSGDGPIGELSDNITETYVWTTIITQIKAKVWPTIARSKVLTPKPKPIRVFSTPIISCHKFWSQIQPSIKPNSEDLLDFSLRRTSIIYPGPSSTIALSLGRASSDISMSLFGSELISISESMQSYFASKSVIPSDRLTQHFSTKDYILSSSFKINSNSYSIPTIESSFTFQLTESVSPIEPTPIHWSSISIESDKNSISENVLSFWTSKKEDIVSTDKPFITSIESSFRLIPMSTTPSAQTKGELSETIDNLQSTPVKDTTSAPATTPTQAPLCPESLQTQTPRESLEKPFEEYLIRTVLNKTSNESMANTTQIERNLRLIYIYALKKQYNITDQMATTTRKLLSNVNDTDIKVKLWGVIRSEGSDQIHVIYYVEKDGALIPYEDAFRTLSYISDDKYSEMIGLTVIEKVKPYNVKMAKSTMNWWSIIIALILLAILMICVIIMACLWWKYRSNRRKLIDALHSQLNRVVPDNQIHWRTVSKPIDPNSITSASTNDRTKADDNRNEFQYLRFESNKKQKESKNKSISKGTQIESSLEMQKQKVIPIGKLIDESTDSNGRIVPNVPNVPNVANEYIKTTFVTTKEIETKTDSNDRIPRLMPVQMSAQTESIIRAIRSELNRFGHTSNAIPFIDDTQPEESIISNSSEA